MPKFAVPFVFLAVAALGLALGGWWTFLVLPLTPIALLTLDGALGEAPPGGVEKKARLHRWTPRLFVPAQGALIIAGAVLIARHQEGLVEFIGVTTSVGLMGGVFGMSAAHEVIHKPDGFDRTLGLTMLAFFGYMHFAIAHVHGHHVRGATPADPATARRGEGVYGFMIRSIGGQAREAWEFEARRLSRRGKGAWSLGNRVVFYGLIQAAILAVVAIFSLRAAGFWTLQAAISIMLLELFNYIAHYGLERRRLASGRYERMGPQHSWNASQRMNNWALFNMGRHSDHHQRPQVAYQRLEASSTGPELPSDYAGAILLALVPPLWRKVMEPRLEALDAADGTLACGAN